MKKEIYLSVDLDYWRYHSGSKSLNSFLIRLLRMKRRGLPFKIVETHEKLVPHINKSGLSHIINVDYHSDIVDGVDYPGNRLTLNEGTWANFINKRLQEKGCFEWRFPHNNQNDLEDGYCHQDWKNPFKEKCTKYEKVIMKHGLKGIDFKKIGAIGISISRDWLEDNPIFEPVLRKLLNHNLSSRR